ncbi:MAG: hypothetical protein ACXWAC_15780 [Usitatibacter sp.]
MHSCRAINTHAKLCAAASIFLAGVASSAFAKDVPILPDRSSPFLEEFYRKPLPADNKGVLVASLVLSFAGQRKDGELLDRFAQRRALKSFLREPFEFSGTTASAIEHEASESEAIESLRGRVLGAVDARYAPPGKMPPQPAPEFRHAGNGIWVLAGPDRVTIHIPMTVRNALKEPVKQMGFAIGKMERAAPAPYYLYLTCKPEAGATFAPGTSQLALCSGYEHPRGMDLAVEALRKRSIPVPMVAYSIRVPTDDAVIAPQAMAFNEDVNALPTQARNILAEAGCKALGTCEEIERRVEARRVEENKPRNFLWLSVACVVLAGLAATLVKPREAKGWFVPAVATAVIGSSIVAALCMFGLLQPHVGYEGFLYVGYILYGAIPHAVGVLVVAGSLLGGSVTRFRTFALGLGLLAPALVWAAYYFLRQSYA